MFNNVYRLTSVKQIERMTTTIDPTDATKVVIQPLYLSICRADERYYLGLRDKKVLDAKLPLALIHEGVGGVVRDNTGHFNAGDVVAMVPNHAYGHDDLVEDNYLRSSTFSSSSEDGFLREYILLEPERLVVIPTAAQSEMNAYLEVVSVAVQAVRRLQETMINRTQRIGIWGDGNVAYITAVVAKEMFPDSEIFVFGKHSEKLAYFSFVKQVLIDEISADMWVDQAIEAVGGRGSEDATNQIIDLIQPRGAVVLSGVSEYPIAVNTRLVLEKGLTLAGTTRSTRADFVTAIDLITNHEAARERLEMMVQNVVNVRSEQDIVNAFDGDLDLIWGKTVMQWNL